MTFWSGRRVLVTGHTGFKGSWLSWWLMHQGAQVHGLALPPSTSPSMFAVLGLERELSSHNLVDIRHLNQVKQIVSSVEPEVVFHLAAQPLVRYSYQNPVETYEVNVMGAIHLLEAIRFSSSVRVVVNVTTDKCYKNREWAWSYRESDELGGHDPYSNSKACSELVTSAYRSSFLLARGVAVATARAGNVIGGGDWATDRLVPDFLRAIDAGSEIVVRSPRSIRPWQHVLEPLSGYLALAERMWNEPQMKSTEWNFGPREEASSSVEWIVKSLCDRVPGSRYRVEENASQPHEAGVLRLDSSLAQAYLSWEPRWNLSLALEKTLEWHHSWKTGSDMKAFTTHQISEFEKALGRES